MVGHVDRSVDPIEEHKVAVNPVTEGEEFNIDVSCARGGFLSITHGSAAIVIFVEECSSFLGNVEVPEDTSYVKYCPTGVTSGHELKTLR